MLFGHQKFGSQICFTPALIVYVFTTLSCSNGGTGRKDSQSPPQTPSTISPPDKGACLNGSGTSLALKTDSNELKVSYQNASENGKDISGSASMKAIILKYCSNCHKSGGMLSFGPPMTTYEEAKSLGAQSLAAVKGGTMPPLNPFASKGVIRYFEAWSTAGFPETLAGPEDDDQSKTTSGATKPNDGKLKSKNQDGETTSSSEKTDTVTKPGC